MRSRPHARAVVLAAVCAAMLVAGVLIVLGTGTGTGTGTGAAIGSSASRQARAAAPSRSATPAPQLQSLLPHTSASPLLTENSTVLSTGRAHLQAMLQQELAQGPFQFVPQRSPPRVVVTPSLQDHACPIRTGSACAARPCAEYVSASHAPSGAAICSLSARRDGTRVYVAVATPLSGSAVERAAEVPGALISPPSGTG